MDKMQVTVLPPIFAFEITDAPALDPITCTVQDLGPGQGKLGIECWGSSWSSWWGAMGDRDLLQFVASADCSYLLNCLVRGAGGQSDRYIGRIVPCVIEAAKRLVAQRAQDKAGGKEECQA